MDGDSHSSLWSKVSRLFNSKDEDYLEKTIKDAQKEGEVEIEESNMLLSILELSETQAQDIMTPRTDIEFIASGVSILEAGRIILKSGHSRFPIYEETRDNIIGIIYAKDLLSFLTADDDSKNKTQVNSVMREPYFIPETKVCADLLQEFRSRKNHLAIVIDEYGGTSGLITIEDLLEIIVGDIEDEHDTPKEEDIVKISDEELTVNGRTYLEDLAEYGIVLESDEMDTIGGFLSLHAGHVPKEKEHFHFNGWDFVVINADAKQIHKISATKSDGSQLSDEQ